MKRFVFGLLVLLGFAAASFAADATTLAGVYKQPQKLLRFAGEGKEEAYDAEDVVELVEEANGRLYFRVALNFANGHSCGLYGIARPEGERFVYHHESCTFFIGTEGNDLVLTDRLQTDGVSTCQSYCGARGSLGDFRIALAKKRPIRYLPRLRKSRQHEEAVAKDRKAS